MPLVKLTLGYDGTDFYGSQIQIQGRTVQSELEAAAGQLAGKQVRMAFAGRTDRGVHAVGQVASVEIPWQGSPEKLRNALNSLSPTDIVVARVEWAHEGFHARFSARWREYRYRVVVSDTPPVLAQRTTWWRRDAIDGELARTACQRFEGTHAYGSFVSGGWSTALTPQQLTRSVYQCQWIETSATDSPEGSFGEIRIVANGFMPQMVRNIAGAVVQVATEAQPVTWIDELLVAGDRGAMSAGAPPHGLILWRVGYTEFDNGSQA